MESEALTKAFLVQALNDLQRRMIQRLESSMAHAQVKTLYWMVGTFLATTALVGMSVIVYTITLRSQL